MAAFDTAVTPVAVTPSNTSVTDLFTASDDAAIMVDAANISAAAATIRIGVVPSGGSVSYRVYDLTLGVGDALLRYGPVILQTGDKIQVRSGTASAITYSADGVETS